MLITVHIMVFGLLRRVILQVYTDVSVKHASGFNQKGHNPNSDIPENLKPLRSLPYSRQPTPGPYPEPD
jgi:hypothetical protein